MAFLQVSQVAAGAKVVHSWPAVEWDPALGLTLSRGRSQEPLLGAGNGWRGARLLVSTPRGGALCPGGRRRGSNWRSGASRVAGEARAVPTCSLLSVRLGQGRRPEWPRPQSFPGERGGAGAGLSGRGARHGPPTGPPCPGPAPTVSCDPPSLPGRTPSSQPSLALAWKAAGSEVRAARLFCLPGLFSAHG